MKNLQIIITVLLISFIAASFAKPKGTKKNHLKIIDGVEVTPHSMPYVVAIRTVINDLDILCGGSLISAQIVLTAASCVYGTTEAEIILGAHDLEKLNENGQETITSTEFIIHEKYDNQTLHDDIALIQLPRAVTLSSNINTINLPEVTDIFNTYDEQEATVAGWGKVNDTTIVTSNVLRSQNLTIIPVLMCDLSYLFNIRPSQMCTSGVSKKNICRGDGGSPLVLDGKLIGIASYGSAYGCSIGFPSVYTRVTSYLNWLLLSIS